MSQGGLEGQAPQKPGNSSRFIDYVVTCAMGEDPIHLRKVVRQKVAAIIKERDIEVPAAKSWGRAAAR